mmetsp:Transcript_24869/g.61276  ORF Transcript_24869/g.61276 Transcript_24869/m.61276 type:complete len:239 (+) Transcript_24869:748-1464(+)
MQLECRQRRRRGQWRASLHDARRNQFRGKVHAVSGKAAAVLHVLLEGGAPVLRSQQREELGDRHIRLGLERVARISGGHGVEVDAGWAPTPVRELHQWLHRTHQPPLDPDFVVGGQVLGTRRQPGAQPGLRLQRLGLLLALPRELQGRRRPSAAQVPQRSELAVERHHADLDGVTADLAQEARDVADEVTEVLVAWLGGGASVRDARHRRGDVLGRVHQPDAQQLGRCAPLQEEGVFQ